MKILLAILSVVLFANQADSLDISQYKKMNEIGKFLYLGGIAEALLVSYEFNRQMGNKQLICIPPGTRFGHFWA